MTTKSDGSITDTNSQPAPAPNSNPAVWALVIKDMADRDAFGYAKYGTRLQPGNGRDFLIDAYQEALDLAVYLRGAIYERDMATAKQSLAVEPAMPTDFGQQHTIEPAPKPVFVGSRCIVCKDPRGHGGLQCPTMRASASAMLDASGQAFEPASLIDDESPRQIRIHQGGELAEEVYSELDRLKAAEDFNADIPVGAVGLKEPQRARHQCLACGLGHATHLCTGGER